jgi:hypothetical protein
MRCAIMQPTVLPWSGYFNLVSEVDVFVLLDDVQFQRCTWHQRNRVLLQGKEHVLTVPVRNAPLGTRIADILLVPGLQWRQKHWRTLTSAYGKAAHGSEMLAMIEAAFNSPVERLAVWSRDLIACLAQALGLGARFVQASELNCPGTRSEHVLRICKAVGCDEYISPVGSKEYLAEDGFEANGEVRLRFQSFVPAPYAQPRTNVFVSHLSVIDVIAHHGVGFARDYIRSTHP